MTKSSLLKLKKYKKQMPKAQNKEIYNKLPRQFIKQNIKKIVKNEYKLLINPVLDLPLREVKGAKYIRPDYAFACFGLAQALKIDARSVANKIAGEFRLINDGYTPYLDLEVVGGYINFILNDDYLVWAIQQAAKGPLGKAGGHRRIHVEILTACDVKLPTSPYYDQVYKLIIDTYSRLEYLDKHICLLQDNSEFAALEIATSISREGSKIETVKEFQLAKKREVKLAKLEADIKTMLGSTDRKNTHYSHIIERLQTKWFAEQKANLSRLFATKLIAQSNIKFKVHKKLDRLCREYPDVIIKDTASQGTFYNLKDYAISLRTASGFLYDAAYILYLVDSHLKSSSTKKLILMPTKYHGLIEHFSRAALDKPNMLPVVADISPSTLTLLKKTQRIINMLHDLSH
jgi:hypothetical protein